MADYFSTYGLFIPIGVFLILASCEGRFAARGLTGNLETRWVSNIALYAISTCLVLLFWLAGLSATSPKLTAASLHLFDTVLGWAPWAVQLTVTLLALDCAYYWFHRMVHRIPAFWLLHSVHHADCDVDATTSFRQHPGEEVLVRCFGVLLVLLLDVPILFAAIHAVLVGCVGLIQHANLALPAKLDTTLRRVLVTPVMHCFHHAPARAVHDTNYGAIFSFWDRLFGTYYEAARPPETLGLAAAGITDQRLDEVLLLPLRMRRAG